MAGWVIGGVAEACSRGGVLDVHAVSASAAKAATAQAHCKREALMKVSSRPGHPGAGAAHQG
jgi:hypothetical protein